MTKSAMPRAVLVAAMLAAPMAGHSQTPPPAPESPAAKVFATLPTPAPTENICQQADGSIYVTMMDDRKLLKFAPDGAISEFISVPAAKAMIGVACGDNEVSVVVFNNDFRGKPNPNGQGNLPANFSDTATHILVHDLSGKLKTDVAAEKGMGINGFDSAGKGVYYGGDSNSGTIYRIDTAAKKIEPWWRDAAYGPGPGQPMGINGVRAKNGWMYFSSPAKNGLYKVKIGADGKAQGGPEIVEVGLRVDDFDVADDGSVYFPNGRILFKVSSAGVVTPMADPVQGGPSALVSNDGKWVYWPTRGGNAPQRLMRVAIP